jgi:hypothetical protein
VVEGERKNKGKNNYKRAFWEKSGVNQIASHEDGWGEGGGELLFEI